MQLNRRLFVAGAAATPISFYFAGLPAFAQGSASSASADPSGPSQFVAAQNFRFGDRVVTAISDGFLDIDISLLSNVEEDEAEEILRERFAGGLPIPTGVNVYLVRGTDETVLIDAGGGSAFPGMGNLAGILETIGVDPADIDVVLLTHMHPDHIGGMAPKGTAAFPNARVRVHRNEIDLWSNDEAMAAAGEDAAPFFQAARGVLEAYGDRIEAFSAEEEVAHGITARELFGHTPGHCGFVFGEGEDQLFVWGDIVHVAPLQLARPQVGIDFDLDPEAAIATREALLPRVVEERTRVAGMHVSFPGIGHVVAGREEGTYDFVPERWQLEL